MEENEIARIIFTSALEIHKALGPGLLESAYEQCLFDVLQGKGLLVERQKILPLVYNGKNISNGYRIDLLVNNKVIIEVKAVSELSNIHFSQLLTYLKLSDCKLGLLINFNVLFFKTGVKRVVNNL